MTLTTERLNEMLAGCEGVTPGPWKVYDGSSWRRIGTVGGRYDDCAVLYPNVASDGHPDMQAGRGQDTYANLHHIANCDPQTITALITGYMEREAELVALREAVRPFAGDKAPSHKKTERDYDQHGLRRMMSPMEIAMLSARKAIALSSPVDEVKS